MKRAARSKSGSVVFDKRRKTWNFLWWEGRRRRSRLIGAIQQFPTKAAAREATMALQPINQESACETDEMTVSALAAKYVQSRLPSRRSTARVYLSWLNRHILPEWGNKHVVEVKPWIVESWLNRLPLSRKSKKHVKNMMHALVDFAMFTGDLPIERNPVSLVRVYGREKRKRKPRNLTVNEFWRLNTQLKEPFRTISLLCVCFGLRISEALALRWSDLDWDKGTLQVERGIVEQNVDDVKTEESCRTLEVAPELLDTLKTWYRTTTFAAGQDWVFASPLKIGRLPYSYTGVWRELKRAAQTSGVGDIATHAFRHTYRTWLDSTGTPVGVQQKLMRHTDIRTTMNQYGDALTADMQQAQGKVIQLVFKTA